MIPTPSHTTGPFFPSEFVRTDAADLTVDDHGRALAGTPIWIEGRLVDSLGDPIVNGIIELSQLDAMGRPGAGDNPFKGWGRTWTDRSGRFRFHTFRPGVLATSGRAAHLRLMITGSGLMRPLETDLFFPDDPALESDPQLAMLPDPALRRRVTLAAELDAVYRITLALRGPDETPFLADRP